MGYENSSSSRIKFALLICQTESGAASSQRPREPTFVAFPPCPAMSLLAHSCFWNSLSGPNQLAAFSGPALLLWVSQLDGSLWLPQQRLCTTWRCAWAEPARGQVGFRDLTRSKCCWALPFRKLTWLKVALVVPGISLAQRILECGLWPRGCGSPSETCSREAFCPSADLLPLTISFCLRNAY